MDHGRLTAPPARSSRQHLSLQSRFFVYGAVASLIFAFLGPLTLSRVAPAAWSEIMERLGLLIIPVVFLVAGTAQFITSLLLHRFIARPVQELARTVQAVARTRDLATRAPRFGDDALGRLASGFNEMLSHLQQSERALRSSEARYRHLVETMTEGLAILDPRGHFRYVNERLGLLLGHSPDSLVGAPMASQVAGSHRDALVARLQAPDTQPFEVTLRHPDGDHRLVLVSSAPLRGADDVLEGTLVVLTDLTESKRSEVERRSLGEQLRQAQKMEALGRLAGGVAHDLNNLLTGLDGNFELIRMDLPDDHVALESVEEGSDPRAAHPGDSS